MDAVRRLFFEVVAFFRRGVPLLSGLSVLLWNDPAAAVELQHLEGLLLQRAAVRACFFKLLDHQGANGVGAVAVSIAGIHSGIGVAGRAESVQESDRFSGAVAVPRLVKERLDPEDLPDDRILGEFFPEVVLPEQLHWKDLVRVVVYTQQIRTQQLVLQIYKQEFHFHVM